MSDWYFDPLTPGAYNLISIDPPWKFKAGRGAKSVENHYPTMTFKEIKALPVGDLAAPDCLLIMWTTFPFLEQAMSLLQKDAWGFKFKTGGTWHKRTVHGKTAFGTGYIHRSAGEPWLIGTRGKPKTTRSERNIIDAKLRGHSQKPEEWYAMVERLMPGARRVDIFGRKTRPGWDVWGNQSTLFDEPENAEREIERAAGERIASAVQMDLFADLLRGAA